MAVSILTSNSGTTFLRTGGINKIKIKSNLAWTFKLLPLNDANDITQVMIQTAETEDEEIETTLVGTGTSYENIEWINIVNDLGDGVKGITGQGTTYLNIRADENFTGKDLFAVGYAEAITEPNICDFTVFEQYGKNYYFIYFNYDEEVSGQTIHTPREIEPETTEIPVEIYTNTKSKVTIFGFSGINSDTGEEYVVGTGVTKTGYPDETFVFKFTVPKNKTAENIEYTIRGTSEEDPRYTVEYKVTHKGITPEILLSPSLQTISHDITSFIVNYKIKPLTLGVDLGIFRHLPDEPEGYYTLLETKTVSNSSIGSEEPYYVGAITYECGKNPNKANENNVEPYTIKYRISGATSGETFVVSSSTYDVTTNGCSIVSQLPETYYFYLEYNGVTGYTINVPGDGNQLDGDSDTSYVVTAHSNYGYGNYSTSYTGECITDCQKYSGEEDVFYIKFNIHANQDGSVKDGTITVSGITGPSGNINVTQAGGTEPPGPVDEFVWLSGFDSVTGVEAKKTISGTAGSTYPFTYSYISQLYPILHGSYNGVSVTNSNYGFTVNVDEEYVGERSFEVYLSTNPNRLENVKGDLYITQQDNVKYKFKTKFKLSYTSETQYGIVRLTSVSINNNNLGTVINYNYGSDGEEIPTDGYYTDVLSYESTQTYSKWQNNDFTLSITYRTDGSQIDKTATIKTITKSAPSGSGIINVELDFGNNIFRI